MMILFNEAYKKFVEKFELMTESIRYRVARFKNGFQMDVFKSSVVIFLGLSVVIAVTCW